MIQSYPTKLRLLITALIIFFMGWASGALATAAHKLPPLKIASEATYPPFVLMNPQGTMQGFDVAIVKALCLQMKRQCQFYNIPWDSLIPSLKLGKFDILIGAIAITKAREQQVAFTHPYYQNSVSFVAANKTRVNLSKSAMTGKTVGIQGGTTFGQYLKALYGNRVNINRYPSEEEAFLDLQSGRADVVMGNTALVMRWLAQNNHHKNYRLLGGPIYDAKYFGKGYGFAVRKDNQILLKQLNNALAAIKAGGEYKQIVHQYFGHNSAGQIK